MAVLVVEGEVGLATAPELRTELQSIPPESEVVVDLCETLFMGSTGLKVLLDAHAAFNRGIAIACKPDGPIARLFDVSLAGHQLPLYESRADALADVLASAPPQRQASPVADPDSNE